MMRREFSSQHPASSTTTPASTPSSAASSTTSTTAASTTSNGSSSSPIHLRRNRRRASCRHNSHGVASASIRRPCGSHAAKTSTLLARNPALAHKLHQMALPLSPLVQLTTGAVHPDFPSNVLQFWLLTDSQLEALAAFYHQTVAPGGHPSPWAAQYPCPVRWRSDAPLECKRRRMGRFIGLRGCESPVMEASIPPAAFIKTEDDIAREARLARLAADDEALRRKTAPGPFGR